MGYTDGYLSEIITWNDVMPVVEKIESISDLNKMPKIEAIWKCIVEFIKWYNQNK